MVKYKKQINWIDWFLQKEITDKALYTIFAQKLLFKMIWHIGGDPFLFVRNTTHTQRHSVPVLYFMAPAVLRTTHASLPNQC